MSRIIGIAVVGHGYWGPNLVRTFADCPESDLVMVCDKKPERLSLIRRRYPSVICSSEIDDVLRHPRVEAVALATPVSSHFGLARRIIESGKHVLVEKPMATSVRE